MTLYSFVTKPCNGIWSYTWESSCLMMYDKQSMNMDQFDIYDFVTLTWTESIYFLIIFASLLNKILWEINYISNMFSFLPQNNFIHPPEWETLKSKKGEQISTKGRVQHFWTTPTTSWVSYVSHLHYMDFKIPWYVTHALHWSVIYSISVLKRWEKNNIYVRRRYIKVIGNVIRSLVKLFGRKFRIELNLCYLYEFIIYDMKKYTNEPNENWR